MQHSAIWQGSLYASHFLVLSMIVYIVCTFLSFHTWTDGLAHEDRTRDTWTIATTNTDARLAECILLRIIVNVSGLTANLRHINLLHGLIFSKVLFHGWWRSVIHLIDSTHMSKVLFLRMEQRQVASRSPLLIIIRCSNIDYFRLWSRIIRFFSTKLGNETLMLWHFIWISTVDHYLAGVWTSSNRTNIRLLNMIVCIKIRIYLNMVVIPSWLLRFNITIKWGILHVTVEWTLRYIC